MSDLAANQQLACKECPSIDIVGMLFNIQIIRNVPNLIFSSVWSDNTLCMTLILLYLLDLFSRPVYSLDWFHKA